MNWKDLLKGEIEYVYGVTEGLLNLVDDDKLNWKPSTGNNWMMVGQLLQHASTSCGSAFKGFVTGDWGIPEEQMKNMSPEDMLPPAEKMPTVESVAAAKKLLAEDKQGALGVLAKCSEDDLANKSAPAPWDPTDLKLGHRLLQMVHHLNQHKGQLYYYLKLQGKPVDTSHLWGM